MAKLFWIFCGLLLLALLLYPISSTLSRLATLLTLALLWVWSIYLWWLRPRIRYLLLGMPVTLILVFSLPGRTIDSNELRQTYVTTLQWFKGTAYQWGGENEIGIDCSGLVRQGLIRANFLLGLKTLNGRLLRESVSLWWHDASAQMLRDEYLGQTKRLFTALSLNQVEYTQLLPGDFAVTTNGIHTLAYLGNHTWLEADPDIGKVITVQVPAKNIIWFNMPVYLMRWRQF